MTSIPFSESFPQKDQTVSGTQTKLSFQKDDLQEAAAKAFACNSLAYRIVDDPYFRKFLDVYARAPTNEKKLITRKSVSSAVRYGGIKVEEKIHNVLVTSNYNWCRWVDKYPFGKGN